MELDIKDLKELLQLNDSPKNNNNLLKSAIGKYVIVRTRNEGINCGKLIDADETGCVIEDARRIYYHKPKDKSTSWYEGVSLSGLSEDSKISCPVEKKYIIEDYSLTICSDTAEENLRSYVSHKTND